MQRFKELWRNDASSSIGLAGLTCSHHSGKDLMIKPKSIGIHLTLDTVTFWLRTCDNRVTDDDKKSPEDGPEKAWFHTPGDRGQE
jgi:hypothetical protein